jgi:hypothetical protein
LSVEAAILRITMRGDDLLLAHLALLDGPGDGEEPSSAPERLEIELGAEFATALVAALTHR